MAENESAQKPNRYTVEMSRIAAGIEKSANVRANIKTIFKYSTQIVLYVCSAVCIWRIGGSLPETLKMLAEFIRALNAATIVHAIVTVMLAVVVYLQRRRLKRLTAKSGEFRHQIEYTDAVNGKSGLRPDGTAAEDERED